MADSEAGATRHPLGPILYRTAAKRPVPARLIATGVLAGCAALLSVAVYLTPDERGFGSHQQLGYPPCTFIMLLGYPCPTCGMTTAFTHLVRGELVDSFQAHPAGLFFGLATLVAAGVAISTLVTGKVWVVNWRRVSPARVVVAVLLLVLAGWLYKLAVGVISGVFPVGR